MLVSDFMVNSRLKNTQKYFCGVDLIHYLFAPLILFRVPYTIDLPPYYLPIANSAGGVGIFELLVFV